MPIFSIIAAAMVALMGAPVALGQTNNTEPRNADRAAENQQPRETEVMLRKHIEGMRIGKPIYDMMTPALVAAVKPNEELSKTRLAQLGAIRSIEFRGAATEGVDTYSVQYENGASEYFIGLTAEGKIRALVVRQGK